MQFAGSNPVIKALALYSGYDPGAIGSASQKGRSVQRQTATRAEAMVKENELLNEGRLAAAEYGIAAEEAQVPSMGSVIGTSLLSGLGKFAGPIASGLNSPSTIPAPKFDMPYDSNFNVNGMTPTDILTSDIYKSYNPFGG